jgi:hypothetical protein
VSRTRPVVAAIVVALAGPTVPLAFATPAQAAPPFAYPTWADWRYTATDQIDVDTSLPGATATGVLLDEAGSRTGFLTVADTAKDGKCASADLLSGGDQLLGSAVVCDGEQPVTFVAGPSRADLYVFLRRQLGRDGRMEQGVGVNLRVPSSAADPPLRQAANGAGWGYYSPDHQKAGRFEFQVKRNHSLLSGYGTYLPGGQNTVVAAVRVLSGAGCVTGAAKADNVAGTATVCGPDSWTPLPPMGMTGAVQLRVCDEPSPGKQECLGTAVQPVN